MRFTLTLAAGALVLSTAYNTDSQVVNKVEFENQAGGVANARGLQARKIVEKRIWVSMPREGEVQFYIKFHDHVRGRLNADGTLSAAVGGAAHEAQAVVDRWKLNLRPAFEHSVERLEAVQQRAADLSGLAQPDLAGIMQVEWPENLSRQQVELAANELNQCAGIEFVELQAELKIHGGATPAINQAAMQKAMAAVSTSLAEMALPPNLTASQPQNSFFNDVNMNGVFDPAFPFYWLTAEFIGGVDVRAFQETGQWILDNNLQHHTWNPNRNGGRGATVNVGVIEFNANLDHVDLVDVILEPGQTLLPPQLGGFSHWNHGTATLGQIVAKDHGLPGPDRFVEGDDAEVGMIGIAPDAQGWFFPTTSMQGGSRLPSAILSALEAFTYGDVLSFSIGPGNGTLLVSELNATLFQMANELGILICMSAGNDCFNLDEAEYPLGDVGAIVVGAGYPVRAPAGACWGAPPTFYGTSRPYVRHDFSNYQTDDTDKVHVQAWGANIGTCGYGDLFGDPTDLTTANQWYTAGFGGTSGACPMIAGIACCVQGLSQMFYGTKLGGGSIRSIAIGTQLRQDASPNDAVIFGISTDVEECGGACVEGNCLEGCYDPREDSRIIGGFPACNDYFDSSLSVINDLFNLNPFGNHALNEFYILTGRLIEGSLSSLGAIDGAVMIVRSAFRSYGSASVPGTSFPAPVYFFIGQFTDVGVVAITQNPRDVVDLGVSVNVAADAPGVPLVGAEIYNQTMSRWELMLVPGTQFIAIYTGGSDFVTYPFEPQFAPRDYVNLNNGRVLVRGWVYAVGFGSRFKFQAAYDLIGVDFQNSGFGGGADL